MKRAKVSFWHVLAPFDVPALIIIELKIRPLYLGLHTLRDAIKMEAWDELLGQHTEV